MTNLNNWKSLAGLSVVIVVVVLFLTASSSNSGNSIEGTWKATVTATNPPLGSFTNLITFTDKGGVLESRRLYLPQSPFGPILETGGHGAWKRIGSRDYRANFTFLVQGAPNNPQFDGTPLGTGDISLELTLSQDGQTLSGTFRSEPKDEAGNPVIVVEGTYVATRVTVE